MFSLTILSDATAHLLLLLLTYKLLKHRQKIVNNIAKNLSNKSKLKCNVLCALSTPFENSGVMSCMYVLC